MKIGSLFSGIGAMDVACEQHFGARTVWHVERDAYCRSILARHWPDAERHDDVTAVGAAALEPVDILIGGPPCVDLSAAGRRRGLHADRSGLFFEMVRIAAELRPALVVIENVPSLLHDWRGTVEGAMAGAGYGVTWALMAARHAGAPHLRWRVVLLCRRGGRHLGVCRPLALPELRPPGQLWPTPAASDFSGSEAPGAYLARRERVRESSGNGNGFGAQLSMSVRLWPTPTAHDANDSGLAPSEVERHVPGLPAQVATNAAAMRLSARWVEGLQGLPHGWTTVDEPLEPSIWPAPRLGDMWGASPQYDGEPPRVVDPSAEPRRRARLRALGNACPPAQYLAALSLAEAGPRQGTLL